MSETIEKEEYERYYEARAAYVNARQRRIIAAGEDRENERTMCRLWAEILHRTGKDIKEEPYDNPEEMIERINSWEEE